MPGYPLVLAATYSLLGDSDIWMKLLQVFADLSSCLLIFAISKKIFSEEIGLTAMGIALLFPIQILYTAHLMTETVFTCFLLFVVWRVVNEREEKWLWNNVLLGLLLGIAVLIRTTALIVPFAVFIYRLGQKQRWMVNLGRLAFTYGVILIVLSPWIIRNYAQFDRIALTSNGGVNFWMGNHSGASGSYSFPMTGNPLHMVEDEFARSDLGYRLGVEFIVSKPLEFTVLLGKKFAHFFAADYWLMTTIEYNPLWKNYPNAATVFSELSMWNILVIHLPFMAVLLLCTVGLIFHKLDDSRPILFFCSLVVTWLMVHLVFYAGARYRFPVVPFFIITAAYGFHLIRARTLRLSKLRTGACALITLIFITGWIVEFCTIQKKKTPNEQVREYLNGQPTDSVKTR